MMVNKLSFRLFSLIKNNLLTHWFHYRWTQIRDETKGKREQVNHKFLHIRDKTSSSSSNTAPPQIQPFTQSQMESVRNMTCPLSLRLLLRAIKHWDKDAVIEIPIDEAPFGITFDKLVLKDDISQVCNMEDIRATTVTLYIR